ncbi:hypothetical protein PFICI_02488 [Pestalotiopsis fici W106-1]|uniref:Uncharacterized protein n=1 Tax=Pestalotiopsis fici (strain W106-1 / CGMCC3.15140) TaxID=1229662 RepID=W3XED5_PESFW|nr:uncharacterized protein PFICI_02488 [Pestalotiopsis fici W106-1]ETS84463.1 hypothetical protein PFICI_02488 [Pestalotiopsis fici W106-1]
MAGKLTVKIPPSPFVRVSSSQDEEQQRPVMRSLRPKPQSSQPCRRLRDPTDYESDRSEYSESEDEDPYCSRRGELPRNMKKKKSKGVDGRRGSAADGEAEEKHSMRPSPGEYEALLESENNPYSEDTKLPMTTPAGLGGKFSHTKPKSSYSISSSSSSSSLNSQASVESSAPKSKNRWAGFWGGRSPSPESESSKTGQKIVEVQVEVARPKWDSTEETLLKLRREEEAAERAIEEEKLKALERLKSLGITDSGVRCIDR